MGVTERSEAAYASPLVSVKKADRKYRLCINFKELNKITVFDPEPMMSPDFLQGLYTVPEENRDLAGRNFSANFAFSRNIAIFRKFCLGAQFLRKFVTLRSAIFRKVRKFCNLHAICAIYVFPLKFTFSVLSWHAINFSTNWATVRLLS